VMKPQADRASNFCCDEYLRLASDYTPNFFITAQLNNCFKKKG